MEPPKLPLNFSYLFVYYFKDFIYLFMRDAEREQRQEKQAPCKEPDMGLDPRTLRSHPEPKADAQPLSHAGASHRF